MDGIDGEVKVVVEKLAAVLDGNVLRVASDEEKEEHLKMRAVFGIEEWVGVPGLKAQDRRKVNREVKIVQVLMHNPVKDCMSVLEISRL